MSIFHKTNDHKGVALISTLILIFVVFILGIALASLAVNVNHSTSIDISDNKALDLAEAGVSHACWDLGNNINGCQWTIQAGSSYQSTGSLDTGSYSYKFYILPGHSDMAVIESSGTCNGNTRAVKVTVKVDWLQNPSAAFNYALFTSKSATLKGSSSITGDVYAGGGLSGASHVNGNVTTAKNGVIPMPNLVMDAYCQYATAHGTHFPTFDISKIQQLPKGSIVYVDGEIALHGGTLNDITLVSGTGFTVNGNNQTISGGNGLALITNGYLKLNGGAYVQGVIYVHNVTTDDATFTGNGTATVQGSVVCDIVDKINGNITINYDPKVKNIPTLPGTPIAGQLTRLSWQEDN